MTEDKANSKEKLGRDGLEAQALSLSKPPRELLTRAKLELEGFSVLARDFLQFHEFSTC